MNKFYFIIVCIFWMVQSYAQSINYNTDKKKHLKFITQHSKYTQTPNTKIHYLQWGNPNNPTVIWLHGSLSNAIEISNFANEIINLQYNLIAIDYYGHGQTKIPSKKYSAYSLLNDINTLLDSLNVQKCIIGGFSRGAYLATMFYNEYPNRTKALILEDGGVSPFLEHYRILPKDSLKSKFEEEMQSRPKELFDVYPTEEDAYQAILPYGEVNAKDRFKNFSFINYSQGKYKIYKDLDKIYGMDSYENISKLTEGKLVTHPFANDLMLFPFFNTIKNVNVPTLLLEASAENDPFPHSKYYADLKKSNSNIIHQQFSKSDHNIHYNQPEDFILAIKFFIHSHL